MTQAIEWTALNKSNMKRLVGSAPLSILAIRRDGKGYYGTVIQQHEEYVELANGDNRQNLYYFDAPTVFAVIEQPAAPTYKLGQPRLRLEGKNDG